MSSHRHRREGSPTRGPFDIPKDPPVMYKRDEIREEEEEEEEEGAVQSTATRRNHLLSQSSRNHHVEHPYDHQGMGRKRTRDERWLEDKREAKRRERMARLRMENEQEEHNFQQRMDHASAGGEFASKSSGDGNKSKSQGGEEDDGEDDEEAQMQRLMGISGFGSTKGEKVESNHNSSARGAAAKHKARKYRQYMNRKNGFNRPLDHMD